MSTRARIWSSGIRASLKRGTVAVVAVETVLLERPGDAKGGIGLTLFRGEVFEVVDDAGAAVARGRVAQELERQALEKRFWNQAHYDHDVAPDWWGIEDVRRAAFEGAHDVARHAPWIG